MFGSKNYFFKQGKDVLALKKLNLEFILTEIWERPSDIVAFYLTAFDFFCENPDEFDGATIVKDLDIMPGLDIHAMLHDYLYIKYNVSSNLTAKYKADLIYSYEMERMGGSAYSTWSRFVGLTTFGALFSMYKKATGHRMSNMDKQEFAKICVIFN